VEKTYLEEKFGKAKTIFLPLFFKDEKSQCPTTEIKPYVLYQGDLSTPENKKAVGFLIREVASLDRNIFWIIAGLNPEKSLLKLSEAYENVTVLPNPNDAEMLQLIREAAVSILYTNQVSGVKAKLLNALLNGQHCLANQKMVEGSGLERFCQIIPDQPAEILEIIRKCLLGDLPEQTITERKSGLNQIYNNRKNASIIKELLD
jgi:hypothetical protein